MKKNRAVVLLAIAGAFLGGCSGGTSDPPITGDQPAPPAADSVAPLDTITPVPASPVPFVNPTKVGRTLGDQSPSPPASRTR